MWGSDFFFFNQDKGLQLGMNSNKTFWVKWRNDPCPPYHFRNSCGLENITLIKSERQKILSIFIYKNTWEYKKVAKQWGYRLKTEWYLQFLLVRHLVLHLGEPQDSQCHVKKRKKKEKKERKAFDILIFSGPCPVHLAKPGRHLISFYTRLLSGDVHQLNQGHVECHIMTKTYTAARSSLQFVWGFWILTFQLTFLFVH